MGKKICLNAESTTPLYRIRRVFLSAAVREGGVSVGFREKELI